MRVSAGSSVTSSSCADTAGASRQAATPIQSAMRRRGTLMRPIPPISRRQNLPAQLQHLTRTERRLSRLTRVQRENFCEQIGLSGEEAKSAAPDPGAIVHGHEETRHSSRQYGKLFV